ncbi:winged helix-turn-helix transcriptional regulator [Alienimonas californiensis]|uniref:Putative HTH-type transcriptional regulator YtcD n=1 Tax=Alienimonas californiensis TaxID=2527989 RepID=A0A517P3Z5_9PLAN|nr:helix-turn-helix domain-containing protein [Alienimonas californiensis]QDT14086.1 putative HTH-type transcriptional regulator YtcD [Alienimonas californiensis]
MRKAYTPETAAAGVEEAFQLLGGRWKLVILFQLFGGKVRRYSDLERLVPGISQKMLAQQLRRLEADGLVSRTVYPQVPPKVEYRLTEWGQSLCPALDALLTWAERKGGPLDPAPPGAVEEAGGGQDEEVAPGR